MTMAEARYVLQHLSEVPNLDRQATGRLRVELERILRVGACPHAELEAILLRLKVRRVRDAR